jgi:hypothetical protein
MHRCEIRSPMYRAEVEAVTGWRPKRMASDPGAGKRHRYVGEGLEGFPSVEAMLIVYHGFFMIKGFTELDKRVALGKSKK